MTKTNNYREKENNKTPKEKKDKKPDSSKLSNLQQRVIAGVIGGTFIISAIVWNKWSYFALFFMIALLSLIEFYKLSGLNRKTRLYFYGIGVGMAAYTLSFLSINAIISARYLLLLLPLLFGSFLWELYDKHSQQPFQQVGWWLLGLFYTVLPFCLLHFCAFRTDTYSYQIVLGILLLIWANDTGAYFMGKAFGKHALFSRVSPKKSWEGSVGGFVWALGVAFIISVYYTDLVIWQWLVVACLVAVMGSYGDLTESLFKRSIQIKDSGSIIPGHGGFLDRFDGWLMAIPFITAFLKIF